MIGRLIFVIVLVVGTQLMVQWIEAGKLQQMPSEVIVNAAELPMQLDEWNGEEIDLDKRTFVSIGADSATNRLYHNDKGDWVSVHVAVWSEQSSWTPHHPEVCYPGSGWEINGTDTVSLESGNTIDARLMMCHRRGEDAVTLFWYQMGDLVYVDRDGGREAHVQLRNRGIRPPLIKILLQVSGTESDVASIPLSDIGKKIGDWAKNASSSD